MDLFSRVNGVYCSFFGSSPPARACVAVNLPPPFRITLEAIAYVEHQPQDRHALHVQGLSYWAPANIGPYSQAVLIDQQRLFISGQIGLFPSSLTIPSPPSLPLEAALACQHAARVVKALRSQWGDVWSGHTQLALYWLSNANDLPRVQDPCSETEDAGTPTLFLVVSALPKDALIEKQIYVHTGRFVLQDEDGDDEIRSVEPTMTQGQYTSGDGSLYWQRSHFLDSASTCMIMCSRGRFDGGMVNTIQDQINGWLDLSAMSIRVFYRISSDLPQLPFLFKEGLPVTSVPCRRIATRQIDNWDYAICILGI